MGYIKAFLKLQLSLTQLRFVTGFRKMCIVSTKQNVEKIGKQKIDDSKKMLTCIAVFIHPSHVFLLGFTVLTCSQLQ